MKTDSCANWKGILVVLSAPSGAGKTSLCRAAVERLSNLTHSISYTTRPARPGEVHGRDYFFVEESSFKRMIQDEEFIEWARVHGHLYGTSRNSLRDLQGKGFDVVLDIDAQGARKLMSQKGLEAVFVFVLTPTFAELEKRLSQRASDSPEEIQRRLKRAREEIAEFEQYDYLLVNDDFDRTLQDLLSLFRAERCSMEKVEREWVKREFLAG